MRSSDVPRCAVSARLPDLTRTPRRSFLLRYQRLVSKDARLGEDRLLNLRTGSVRHVGIHPAALAVTHLAEHRNLDAVGAQRPAKNVDVQLKALTG